MKYHNHIVINNELGNRLAEGVETALNLSDGLIFDSFKLASNSECGLEINSSKIPISLKARK